MWERIEASHTGQRPPHSRNRLRAAPGAAGVCPPWLSKEKPRTPSYSESGSDVVAHVGERLSEQYILRPIFASILRIRLRLLEQVSKGSVVVVKVLLVSVVRQCVAGFRANVDGCDVHDVIIGHTGL